VKHSDKWLRECARSGSNARLEIVSGKLAPRHPAYEALKCERIVITEQGTQENLSIVDFELIDDEGNLHLVTFTGRIILAVASALRGVNMRNHGQEEP